MNNKIQKYREELEKNEAKMTALKERGKALEQKIREAETLEICALMRSENLSMAELVALARSRTENREFPNILDTQAEADAPDAEADHEQYTATDQDADAKRQDYWEDEDEEDEDDE